MKSPCRGDRGSWKSLSESLSLFYPGTSIVFDMSLTYILVALAAVLLNNVVVERLNLHTRITTGNQGHPVSSPFWGLHAPPSIS